MLQKMTVLSASHITLKRHGSMASTRFPSGMFTVQKGQGQITMSKGGIIRLIGWQEKSS